MKALLLSGAAALALTACASTRDAAETPNIVPAAETAPEPV
ncbi:MAG: hypothetical protein QOI38_2420, partial [Sphingomonadales bacterium]|nr:hypothetical protein [Sphingomonadales bacterium]